MAVERRQLMMGGAIAVVVVMALRGLWPSTPVPAAAPAAVTQAAARAGKVATGTAAPGPMAPVKLGELRASRQEPAEAKRNPFRFQPKAVPPPPRPVVVAPPVITEVPRPVMPTGPPSAPPIPLKLIGVLERASGVKWAVLTDGKSGPMYGKDGDIIDGRYTIVKIGTESIEMTYADGRGRQVIRLTGQ